MVFKEVFRYAAHHDFLTLEQAERWLLYRDNRNNTAHGFESDSGKKFAETTLELLADFIIDARALAVAVDQQRVSE